MLVTTLRAFGVTAHLFLALCKKLTQRDFQQKIKNYRNRISAIYKESLDLLVHWSSG